MTIHTSNIPKSRCPSLEELAACDDSAFLEAHLAECARCRARAAALTASADKAIGETIAEFDIPSDSKAVRNAPLRVRQDTRLDFGAICSVASDDSPGERLLVVLLSGRPLNDPGADGAVTVAPLSVEVDFASSWDEVVMANELDLGYDVIAEMWNYGRVSRVQLDESFGRLHAAATDRLERLWKASRTDAGSAPEGSITGPQIVSGKDPRLGFQRDEIERARRFYTPDVQSVRELAGSLVHLLQERLREVVIDDPALGSNEADVLRRVRGTGFIKAPEANALGRLICLTDLDISEGSRGDAALREEATAWIANEHQVPSLMAARSPFGRVRGRLGQLFGSRGSDEADEVSAYIAMVRAAAQQAASAT